MQIGHVTLVAIIKTSKLVCYHLFGKLWPIWRSGTCRFDLRTSNLTINSDSLGLYSLSGKTSYRKISWSLEAARFGSKLLRSLWNLAGTPAALLPRCLSNFRAIRPLQHPISRLRDFTRFGGKTFYRLVNRGPGLPWSQLGTLKLTFNIPSDDQGSHPDDFPFQSNNHNLMKIIFVEVLIPSSNQVGIFCMQNCDLIWALFLSLWTAICGPQNRRWVTLKTT